VELTIDRQSFEQIHHLAKTLGVSYKKLTAELAKIGMETYKKELLVPGSVVVERVGKLIVKEEA
jgi:hypothetical protein